jgi:amino acid adenylation domain-containing protein
MTEHLNENLILTSSRFVKQKEYWLDRLAEGLQPTRFLAEPPPAEERGTQSPPRESERLRLPDQLATDLNQLGKGAHLSIYILTLAVLQTLIYRYMGMSHISVVSPVHSDSATGDTMNHYVLMCNRITGSLSFKEIVLAARASALEAYANQDYPFERILQYVDGQLNRTAADYSTVSLRLPAIHNPLPDPVRRRLLALELDMDSGGMTVTASFDPQRFRPPVVRRFLNHWRLLLRGALDALRSDGYVDRLPLMTSEEREQVLVEFNRTRGEHCGDFHVVEMFLRQAEALPHHAALLTAPNREVLTYACLRDRVLSLAGRLRERGVAAGSIVAIMANDAVNIVVAIMGILTAGGAYLPIDPEYPQERMSLMLRDSGAAAIVLEQGLHAPPQSPPALSISAELFASPGDMSIDTIEIQPEDPAYVMYTSGTTGAPKGVVVEHRNIANLLDWFGRTYGLGPGFRILQLTEYTFDPSVEDIIGSLVWGATIVPGHRELLGDRELFCRFVQSYAVNMINFIPTMLEDLLCHDTPLESLKYVILGGEPLSQTLKDRLAAAGYRVFNHYGPTETATDAVTGPCDDGPVTLGRPIANTRCYILNGNQPLPVGVAGELCIAGAGVGRGYLNNPELTAARFTADPFAPGQRMYRTGDLARFAEDGAIDYLGRIDRQVKVRGFRIELQEVESQMLRHPQVKEAVVKVAHPPRREPFLCAYLVPRDRDFDGSAIGEFLSLRLPYYMVPSRVIPLEKMPLTPSGKIDREALPHPGSFEKRQYKAPVGAIEETLQTIWAQVLKREPADISRDDNFFQLGGHSLLVTVLLSKIQKELGANIPFTDVFKNPTIEALARLTGQGRTTGGDHDIDGLLLLRSGKPGGSNLFFINDGTGVAEVYGKACHFLDPHIHCWGILPHWRKDIAPQEVTIEELAGGYIDLIKGIQPNGPYAVAGWCIGGTIAAEIARQLELDNQTCRTVIISSLPPDRDAVSYDMSFSLQSELELLEDYMAGFQLPEEETATLEIRELWRRYCDYLQQRPEAARILREKIPPNWARTIPKFESLDTKQVCWYLNTIRSLYNARNRYIPETNLKGTVYYIQPPEDGANVARWQEFVTRSITVQPAPGDHYSLFEELSVEATAAILDRILENCETF